MRRLGAASEPKRRQDEKQSHAKCCPLSGLNRGPTAYKFLGCRYTGSYRILPTTRQRDQGLGLRRAGAGRAHQGAVRARESLRPDGVADDAIFAKGGHSRGSISDESAPRASSSSPRRRPSACRAGRSCAACCGRRKARRAGPLRREALRVLLADGAIPRARPAPPRGATAACARRRGCPRIGNAPAASVRVLALTLRGRY